MLRAVLAVAFVSIAGSGQAACPDFYRFVDFGLTGSDGLLYRGGPIYRAEGLNGAPLLIEAETLCREVPRISSDGHGNPIPVARRISYDPERTGLDVLALRLATSEDVATLAEENAGAHRVRAATGAGVVRGETFLCAGPKAPSCQVVSPYKNPMPLVAYCDAETCTMPVLAVSDAIYAMVQWSRRAQVMDVLGEEVAVKAMEVRDFLAPLTASN